MAKEANQKTLKTAELKANFGERFGYLWAHLGASNGLGNKWTHTLDRPPAKHVATTCLTGRLDHLAELGQASG